MGPARVSAPGPTPPAGYRLLGKTGRLEGRDPLTRTLSVPRPLASVCPWPPCFSALCREPSKYGIDAHLPKKLEDAGKYCMNATGLRGWGRPAVERGGGPESCSLEEPGHPKMGEASPYRQAQVSREPGTPVLGGVQRPPPPTSFCGLRCAPPTTSLGVSLHLRASWHLARSSTMWPPWTVVGVCPAGARGELSPQESPLFIQI